MKILCTIKRRFGTHPKMPDDGTVYDFAPNEKGDHVCEVTNLDHVTRLLAIPSFEPYGDDAVAEAEAQESEGNELDSTEAEIRPGLAPDLNSMTLEELQAEYHYRFGKAAHHLAKHGTLVAKLAAARMKPDETE
jgi:hypothetical protein